MRTGTAPSHAKRSLTRLGAIEDYSHVINLNPKDAEALRGRGLAHLHLHEYKAAIADLIAAIALNPTDLRAYRYRSLAFEGNNDFWHEELDDAMTRRLDLNGGGLNGSTQHQLP